MTPITAPQVIYLAHGYVPQVQSQGRCRICGGELWGPEYQVPNPNKSRWEKWTDENLIADPYSDKICAACMYCLDMRQQLTRGPVMMFNKDYAGPIAFRELYDHLVNKDISVPAFFFINGNGKKHGLLRVKQGVTHTPEHFRIGVAHAKLGDAYPEITGIAELPRGYVIDSIEGAVEHILKTVTLPRRKVHSDDFSEKDVRSLAYKIRAELMRRKLATTNSPTVLPTTAVLIWIASELAAYRLLSQRRALP